MSAFLSCIMVYPDDKDFLLGLLSWYMFTHINEALRISIKLGFPIQPCYWAVIKREIYIPLHTHNCTTLQIYAMNTDYNFLFIVLF